MASVFSKEEEQERSVIEIVRDSLDVDAEGVVRFRSRVGRGSGKAVEIPGVEFEEFVTLMNQTRESREALAQQQREADVATTNTASETSVSDSITSETSVSEE